MRPLELRLRNFRSFFGDGHIFDFRDRRLLGIVGPIGAGKSSILDAIAFALYGRTPRIAGSTKSLIHQRADSTAVALRFEIDGQIWEAVRQLRRTGASQHALYLLEDDTPDPDTADKIVMESAVNQRIEELLGFDYDAFGRSVLLAQGQFDEFLNAQPRQRDKVLKGVFGHERIDAMRELAKAKHKEATHEIEKLDIRLEEADAAKGLLPDLGGALALKTTRIETLEKIRPEYEELTARVTAAEKRIEEAGARRDDLTGLAGTVPDAQRSEKVIAHAERARNRRAQLGLDLDASQEVATRAGAVIQSDEFGQRSTRFKQAAEMVVRLEAQEDTATTARADAAATTTRVVSSRADLEEVTIARTVVDQTFRLAAEAASSAKHALAEAETTLLDARHADMAASLRHELEIGRTCPVCDQPVHELPATAGGGDAQTAQVAAEAARLEAERSEGGLLKATAGHETAKAAKSAAKTRLEEAEKDLVRAGTVEASTTEVAAAARAAIADLLGEGDPAVRLEAERMALDRLGAEVEAARKAVEDVRRALDEAIDVEQEADRELGDLRTRLGALATRLDSAAELPKDDPTALRTALTSVRDGWKTATIELQAAIEQDQTELAGATAGVAELRGEHQIEGSLPEEVAAVGAEAKIAGNEIERLEDVVAGSVELTADRERKGSVATSFGRLATDLTDAKFIRFLLDEERAALAELGSDHFQRLSSGRYRFTEDGDFRIVDLTSADSVRMANSLSGGETFLASLALALGLSEMVGRTGGRLDAFFLDEGFGALDHEHLDLAMEGIEALVTDHQHRLVVVVSHVPELRHRIEDLIVLDKDPVTGDSVIVSGAVV